MNNFTLSNNTYKKFYGETEGVNFFQNQLRQYEPLTQEEEIELFKQIESNINVKEAVDKIVLHNQRFIYANAKQYARDEDEVLDYENEGVEGLMKAIENFKLESGNRFITYAVWFVRRQMNFYLINTRDSVVKSNAMKMFKKVDKVAEKFFAENGRYPIDEEVIELLNDKYKNINVKDIRDLYEVQFVSIQESTDDDYTYEDSNEFASKTSVDNTCIDEEEHEYNKVLAHQLLSKLDFRDRSFIKKVYGIGSDHIFTVEEIADYFGISVSEANKRKQEIIDKLLQTYKQQKEEKIAI